MYGGRLKVFTDHENYAIFENDIKLTYLPGKNNILADAYLCLPSMQAPLQGKNEYKRKLIYFRNIEVPIINDDVFFMQDAIKPPQLLPTLCRNKDTNLLELSMNLPTLQEMSCPVTPHNIQPHQARDP